MGNGQGSKMCWLEMKTGQFRFYIFNKIYMGLPSGGVLWEQKKSDQGTSKDDFWVYSINKELQLPEWRHPLREVIEKEWEEAGGQTPWQICLGGKQEKPKT